IAQRRRPQVGKLAQRVVPRRVPGRRQALSIVRRQIFHLPLVRLAHCSSGSETLSGLAAGCWPGRLVVASLGGFIAAAVFFAAAFLAVARLPGADFAPRAIASSSWARKPAISSRSA